jgi:hypothetical protein
MILTDQRFARTLLSNLGSFWVDSVEDQAVNGLVASGINLNDQAYWDFLEAAATLSRFTSPAFKREFWKPLTIRKSDVTAGRIVRYGDGDSYGDPLTYGQPAEAAIWSIPVDVTLAEAVNIADRPIDPRLIWTSGLEFRVDKENHRIEFMQDPFLETAFAMDSEESDDAEDPTLTLWLLNADLDLESLYHQFGTVLGIYLSTGSDAYRDLINAFWDCLLRGANVLSLRQALAAMLGIPCVIGRQETVEAITRHVDRLVITSSAHVYEFSGDATETVTVGQVVYAGDFLTDAVHIYEGESLLTVPADVPALCLEPGDLDVPAIGSLVFPNRQLPVSYALIDGKAQVTFPLGGRTDDVVAFWAGVRDREAATGYSVARTLNRDDTTAEPTVDQIPATVNPMNFLFKHTLRDSTSLVVIKMAQAAVPDPYALLSQLKKLIPPHNQLRMMTWATLGAEYNEASEAAPAAFDAVEAAAETLSLTESMSDDLTTYVS